APKGNRDQREGERDMHPGEPNPGGRKCSWHELSSLLAEVALIPCRGMAPLAGKNGRKPGMVQQGRAQRKAFLGCGAGSKAAQPARTKHAQSMHGLPERNPHR